MYAAENGHLKLLQWAHANGCPWDESTCMWAARTGRLKVLQWARANGCPWDESICRLEASQNRHLKVVEWIVANNSS